MKAGYRDPTSVNIWNLNHAAIDQRDLRIPHIALNVEKAKLAFVPGVSNDDSRKFGEDLTNVRRWVPVEKSLRKVCGMSSRRGGRVRVMSSMERENSTVKESGQFLEAHNPFEAYD